MEAVRGVAQTMGEKQPLLKKKRGDFDDNDLSRESYWSGLKELWRQDCCPCIPARYILAIMGFWGFVNVYALRVNLSMAIIEMVNTSANGSSHHVSHYKTSNEETKFFFYSNSIGHQHNKVRLL